MFIFLWVRLKWRTTMCLSSTESPSSPRKWLSVFSVDILVVIRKYKQIKNSLPATHSKDVGTQTWWLLCFIILSINYTFLFIWEVGAQIVADFQRNLCPFLPNARIQLLNSSWLLPFDFPLHDASYNFSKRQMWTAGRPVKHTHTLCVYKAGQLEVVQNEVWHCASEVTTVLPGKNITFVETKFP